MASNLQRTWFLCVNFLQPITPFNLRITIQKFLFYLKKKERQKDTKDTITEVYGNWERGEGIYKEKKKRRKWKNRKATKKKWHDNQAKSVFSQK